MSINQLMFRNLRKNLKNYYLYVFALIFSSALYFAFVTLQFDPSMDATKGSVKGAAAIKAASVLLVAIVSIFLLYANNIFIKRRSKEIGLFQLIGMTKNRIFRILSAENFILYFGSLMVGIFLGFSVSKLIIMALFKTIGVEGIARLHFSYEALFQTLIVFFVIYLFIMLMNYLFIKRQSILSLFRVTSVTEGKVKKVSFIEMIIGLLGILLILLGYYISSKLFSGDFTKMNELFVAMIVILASVIIGTYLFYKGSVRFVFNIIRKNKNGYLNINEVLSLSSIMFRMKSNAVLLTIITTVSALAIGLLSLSYISYYSAEQTAKTSVPADFAMTNIQDATKFKAALTANKMLYTETVIDVIQVNVNMENVIDRLTEGLNIDTKSVALPVISEDSVEGIQVSANETLLTGYSNMLQKFMSLKKTGSIELKGQHEVIPQQFIGLNKDTVVSWYFTDGGIPVAIVDKTVFERLKNDINPSIQKKSSIYIGIDLKDRSNIKKADDIFRELGFSKNKDYDSQLEMMTQQKQNMGLIMFIVAFLGLTFLITSGCILYFKQMDECEDEKSNYTILRKLGFTQGDLLKGIQVKQLFNFGIPLVVGLLHSYFAVQSGGFLFGNELWTPMIIVMILYTALYSIFGILSVFYYKKVIKEAL
ncbi:ABC transporter permease [Paenibacillus macquariensis]|uniref:Bacitracin transport system permease protein n=1 Tax=Paenibacillus macquariensis TaxID=948756 RepID=A0ABY1K4D8_9BACL|nr:ABC transporter permease [Paenibacillus macquariensis]MEC0088977.1 ABC transporter permease [Paenibacillus macquariensis]OAB31882.1 bacitracin ABC transporter permease [Paenibacillus macquariensis subsp. macquariensis]SIR23852.1 bacitracin transport system permease protein [Paenibacillus macquariensis]